jgi:hypothetical protein
LSTLIVDIELWGSELLKKIKVILVAYVSAQLKTGKQMVRKKME